MKFWEIYFTYVEALKERLANSEALLAQWPSREAAAPTIKANPKAHNTTSKSVLIIEPSERNRILISRYLTALSVKVVFVQSEDEALAQSAQKFDLKINTAGMSFPEDKISLVEQL